MDGSTGNNVSKGIHPVSHPVDILMFSLSSYRYSLLPTSDRSEISTIDNSDFFFMLCDTMHLRRCISGCYFMYTLAAVVSILATGLLDDTKSATVIPWVLGYSARITILNRHTFHGRAVLPHHQQQRQHEPYQRPSSIQRCATTGDVADYYWNEEQLMSFAHDEGIVLSISKVGPLIRTIARTRTTTSSGSTNDINNKNDSNSNTVMLPSSPTPTANDNDMNNITSSSLLLGYVEGFIRPTQAIPFLSSLSLILHLDKMEVFQKQIQLARRDTTIPFRNGGTILGVGLLMGYLCILDYVNHQIPATKQDSCMTEFLAIDDETYQHQRLVKYYTTAGFRTIKYVGGDWGDVPDRLIWGGCGTLLRQNCIVLLQKWTKLMERSVSKRRTKTIDASTATESIEASKWYNTTTL